MLLQLRQPVQVDELRCEVENGDKPQPDAQAHPHANLSPDLESKLSQSLLRELSPGSSPDLSPDQGSDSDSDDAPVVPGPGFVLVSFDGDHVSL